MKFSIVTVNFNGSEFISEAIESVIAQKGVDIQYIIIDGNSTDNSIEIINRYKSYIDVIVSEPDKGLYFAMNKGLQYATGDYIHFLNSDDYYASDTVLSEIKVEIKKSGADCLYGNLIMVNRDDKSKIERRWIAGVFNRKSMYWGWMPPHPTFFCKTSILIENNGFNTDFKSAADYELMLRLLYLNKLKVVYLNKTITIMRVGGQSSVSVTNRLKANSEDKQAWLVNKLKPNPFLRFLKPARKILQFLVR